MRSGAPPLPLLLVTLIVVSLVYSVSSLPATSPAFLWFISNRLNNSVYYRTLSPKDLAKSVLYEGGWSNILCSRKEPQHSVDLAIVFIGTGLQSSSITGDSHADPALVNLLKVSFMSSDVSMAFPYVDASGKDTIENLIISEFKESCGNSLGISNGALLGMCTMKEETLRRFSHQHSIDEEYLISRMQIKPKGQAELVIICHKGSQLDESFSESKTLDKITTSLDKLGAKYEVLYVSDPFSSIRHSSNGKLERFLAEEDLGNGSSKSVIFTTCDEVCKIKSSLLEGLLVGIVLLIILISGLCCMTGIDSPTRFEVDRL